MKVVDAPTPRAWEGANDCLSQHDQKNITASKSNVLSQMSQHTP